MPELPSIEENFEIAKAINESFKTLLKAFDKEGYKNPDLNCKIMTEDGRIFKLNFERIDLDNNVKP